MTRWRETVTTLPGVGVSLLPKAVCPICSPAYAALLSSVGLGFLGSTRYLLPVTLTFLIAAVGSLFFRAASRRGLGPFWLGTVAAIGVLFGKFWFDSAPATYVGIGLLITASVWNAIPTPTFRLACLPTTEAGSQNEGI